MQTRTDVIILFLLLACTGAFAQPREALKNQCDALLETSVRRTYGIGWEDVPAARNERHPTQRSVSMHPGGTPGAGIVLLLAGKRLNEPRYVHASIDVARAIAAAQQNTGQIPAIAVFGPTAGGRDEPMAVPDRSATIAGVALMLTVLKDAEPDPTTAALLRRSVTRAMFWLIKQQAKNGAWPQPHPPNAEPKDTDRIIRLDFPNHRDCTFVLLLAAQELKDPPFVRAAQNAVKNAISLRLGVPERSQHLWSTAYTLTGQPMEKDGFDPGADTLATRYMFELLFADDLLNASDETRAMLDRAADSLMVIRRADGMWDRHPERPVEPKPPGFFENAPTSQPALTELTIADFGLDALLKAHLQLKDIGRQQYLVALERSSPLHQRLALTVCGLLDEPLITDAKSDKDPERMEPQDLRGMVQAVAEQLLNMTWEKQVEEQPR